MGLVGGWVLRLRLFRVVEGEMVWEKTFEIDRFRRWVDMDIGFEGAW